MAVSKLIPNKDPTKSHIPVSLRRKDELKASKEAQGEDKYGQLQTEAEKILSTYKNQMTKIFRENAELEVEVKEKALRCKFYELCFKLASCEILTLKLSPIEGQWKRNISERDLAGNAVLKMLSTSLRSDSFTHLGAERTKCVSEFKEHYFKNGIEMATNNDGEFRDGALVGKASVELTKVMSTCVFDLYDHLDEKERQAKLEAELKVMLENTEQWKANADVKEMLDKEDSESDAKIGDIAASKTQELLSPLKEENKQMKQQIKAMQKQIKAINKVKSSGGGTDHSSNVKLNGQGKEENSTKPSKKKKKKKKKQRQQKGNQDESNKEDAKQKPRKKKNSGS